MHRLIGVLTLLSHNFWNGKRVLVTGGDGFIGSHLVDHLLVHGAIVTITTYTQKGKANIAHLNGKIHVVTGDLRYPDICEIAARGQEAIFHLASNVSGVEYNKEHPASMLRDNLLMSTNMLEAARKADVERFLMVSSACVYPRFTTIPTPEIDGFVDMPEETNFGYGWSKRIGELLARTYHQEYGMNIGVVRPYNTYGSRDHFTDEKAHVIPSLIRRIADGESPLVVWGDGTQSRSFLYVDDNVRGMIMALEQYPMPDPINLGMEEEITIRDLAQMIITAFGFTRTMTYDTTKTSAQPRRCCDVRKAKEKLGFTAQVPLAEGIRRTVAWYRTQFPVKEVR